MKGLMMKPLLKWTATSVACLAVIGAVMAVWPGTVSLPASEPAVTVSAPVDSAPDDTVSGAGDTSGTGGTDTSGTGGTSTDASVGTDSSGSGAAPASAPGDTYVESGSGGTGTSHSDDMYTETQDSHDDHDHGTPVRPAEPEHGAGHH